MKRIDNLRYKIILLLGGFIVAKEVVEKGKKELYDVTILTKTNEKYDEILKKADSIWEKNKVWIAKDNKKLIKSVISSLVNLLG